MTQRERTAITQASLCALLASCAAAHAGVVPAIPETLKVPVTQVLSLQAQSSGVQIYECKASQEDPKRFRWVFKAPQAELFDRAGSRIGRHYAGPTWELNDGSQVVGELQAQEDSPDASAIPWLLLRAKSTSGHGVLRWTQSIQRLYTVGGKAPVEGCEPAQEGKEARVAYSATYRFYVEKP